MRMTLGIFWRVICVFPGADYGQPLPKWYKMRPAGVKCCETLPEAVLNRSLGADYGQPLPEWCNNDYSFSDDVLQTDSISDLLRKFRPIKRIRLLSSDILSSNIPLLSELKGYEIETIVNQDYYLAHYMELVSYPRSLKLIVYLDDISHFNANINPMHFKHVNISFFCPINNLADLTYLEDTPVPVFPFPSRYASKSAIHSLLDYSVDELFPNKSDGQLLMLNNVINSYFFGNVIINNAGDILSYPFSGYSGPCVQGKRGLLNQLKNNYYWTIKRSEFFEKCRKCAFLWICPPLTNYEINLQTTFCKRKK